MKALTVRQPWASLIIHGGKTIETRTRNVNIRGRVGIIAGRHPMDDELETLGAGIERFDFGALIGTVELFDCVRMAPCWDSFEDEDQANVLWLEGREQETPSGLVWVDDTHAEWDVADQLPYGDYRPGRWAWMLRDPQPLAEPIPMRGALGWQEVSA